MKLFWLIFTFGMCLFCNGQLTIIIEEIPPSTPDNADLFIAGSFQNWNPGDIDYRLEYDQSNDRHFITIAPGVSSILFKFTRGSWATVEGTRDGNTISNRSHTISGVDSIFLDIKGWEDLDGGGGNMSTAADNVSILTDSFYMPQFNRYRKVWLYLPPDYEETEVSYPVLYMHDGQNCFDASTSFAGEWMIDETLNSVHDEGDPGIIVVAVDNGSQFRTEEYTPWSHPQYGGGDGDKYIDFIINDLKPFIDSNYRTLSDRENTAIMGSSLGGLVSTYGGIEHQDVFSKIGSFSPSYWYSEEAFGQISSVGKQAEMRIYQLMGGQEGQVNIDNMLKMQDTLLAAGFEHTNILSETIDDGEHSEWFWAREFKDAYLWLFNRTINNADEQLQSPSFVKLYPSPAHDYINLEILLGQSTITTIEIITQTGAIIDTVFQQDLNAGKNELHIDIKNLNLSPGIYYCKVQSGKIFQTLTFLKEN